MPLRVGVPSHPYSFLIEKRGNLIVAQDGRGRIQCSGTDAASVIQSAINSLSNGGKILIKRGQYIISSSIVPKYGVVLEGEGWDTELYLANGVNVKMFDISNSTADEVQIRNMRLNGNKDNQTATCDVIDSRRHRCKFVNLEILNFYRHAITLTDGDYQTIENCYIHDGGLASVQGCGIRVGTNSIYDTVKGCFIYNTGYKGIHIYGGASTIDQHALITDNIFWHIGQMGIYVSGYSQKNIIKGNRFLDGYDDNINVASGCNYNTIVANEIIGGSYGYGGENGIIVASNYNIITDNICDYLSVAGIYLGGSYNIVANNLCKNNGRAGTKAGIQVYGTSSTPAQKNIIKNNLCTDDQTTKTQAYGIYLVGSYCPYNEIVYNNVEGNLIAGIRLDTVTGVVLRGNIGYATENGGTATFSGNGSTKTFTIAHGLASTPTKVLVTAGSDAAKGDFYATADATNITVTYGTAPPSGTNNVVLNWYAEV
jgi:parallel beta-helix repeat protein